MDEPKCIHCDKPLEQAGREAWNLEFRPVGKPAYYLHESPCFGRVGDMEALSRKAAAQEAEPRQLTMEW